MKRGRMRREYLSVSFANALHCRTEPSRREREKERERETFIYNSGLFLQIDLSFACWRLDRCRPSAFLKELPDMIGLFDPLPFV